MDLGFDTIGNATLIFYDRRPLLATDPWITGSAYFGSWGLSHEIPPEQLAAIAACRFVWFSHGHPDHLNPDSLELVRGKSILLPDHVGGRIRQQLEELGEDVRVLPDREWVRLSDRVRVLCLADDYQDAILLTDIGGRLVVDLNDASDRGFFPFVRSRIRDFPVSYLLALAGGGDTDMFHFFDAAGRQVLPASRVPVGEKLAGLARMFGPSFVIPFSSMHRYQRRDSLWAAAFTARIEDSSAGFHSDRTVLLPAFVRVSARTGEVTPLRPAEAPPRTFEPEDFGDRWGDPLEASDLGRVERYFRSIELLGDTIQFIGLRVGGREHTIDLGGRARGRGLTFEVPRTSLMSAVEHEVWDDLLIGNFMKTTLHGVWPASGLYPDFSPWVAKVADNGRARTREEVARYLAEYRKRAPLEFLRHRLLERARAAVATRLRPGSTGHALAKRAYRLLKGR